MTFGTEIANGVLGHGFIVRAMRTMTDRTVLGSGRVPFPIPPVLGNLTMAFKADGRLSLLLVSGIG